MKLAIISANLGNFEPEVEWVKQIIPGVEITVKRFTDESFSPRINMSPRLQARIPKMFGWEMVPGFDCYLWVDSSRGLLRPDAAEWFYKQAEGVDLVLFKHPHRNTIKEEAEFIRERMDKTKHKRDYLRVRYTGELIDEQLEAIDKDYIDNCLYASTAFFYWDTPKVREMLSDWWFHTSRYHAVDQLALPYLVWKHKCSVKVLKEDVYNCEYIPVVRK
jgi:hypothetical protein